MSVTALANRIEWEFVRVAGSMGSKILTYPVRRNLWVGLVNQFFLIPTRNSSVNLLSVELGILYETIQKAIQFNS